MKPHPSPRAVRGERVATPAGIVPATLHLADGRVARIGSADDARGIPASEVLDAAGLVVIPGLVDTHVHLNEPGRADWEGFATGTAAAAAGGVTTLLDMPLNSIPATTNRAALAAKRSAAEGQCVVDVGFLGGAVPGNESELPLLWNDGVFAFKCFLVPSGVEEFPNVSAGDLDAALRVLARLGATLMVHAELPAPIEAAFARVRGHDPRDYATYLASRPPAAEVEAVRLVLDRAAAHGARVHIVHVSAQESLPLLARAVAAGVRVSAETCPHYLTLAAPDIGAGATAFKCAPPVRDPANREALWRGLNGGTLTGIVSDHSPAPPSIKGLDTGDFFTAWGGIASLELGLSVIWSELRARSLPLTRLLHWMCEGPARLARLTGEKGTLAPGSRADFVLFDPDASVVVDPRRLHQRHPITPYADRRLHGRVLATYLGGRLIFAEDEVIGGATGRLLRRPGAA
jgi:allantoinase